jgi:PAS domain S-box-containing protein
MSENKPGQNGSNDPAQGPGQILRRRADERLKKHPPARGAKTTEETSPLLYELEVHQIELEMQNEELHRALEELEASKTRYFNLYDLAPVGYLTLSQKGMILEANLTAAQMIGMERNRLAGQSMSRLIFRDDQDIYYLSCRQLLERQLPLTFELRMVGGDGRPFWVQIVTKVAQDSDGFPVWRATLSDITERKRGEVVRQQLAAVVESSEDAIITKNLDGMITSWNKGAERIYGYSSDQIQGKHISVLFPPDHLDKVSQLLKRISQGEHIDQYETVRRRKNGSLINVSLTISPVKDTAGRIVAAATIARDITGRKRVESIRRARFRMLAAANKDHVSVDEFLQVALDEIEPQTGSLMGFYHFLEADQETLSLQNWSTNTLRNLCTAEGKGSHYPISKAGVWVDCVRERRPVIHNDFSSLPHRQGLPPGHTPVIREMVVPIMRGSRIVAIIGVGNKPSEYNETDLNIALLLGDFSWEIVERLHAQQALRERTAELQQLSDTLELQVRERTSELAKANEDLRRISEKLLSAQEAERKRIAGEIHDTLGAGLAAIKFKVEDAQQQMRKVSAAAAESLDILIPVIQENIDECRRIQQDLRPSMLDDLGLLPTLSWFCRRYQTIFTGIVVKLEQTLQEKDLLDSLKIVIFRVTQEGMNNIVKHSKADLVHLSLGKRDGRIELVLKDNGQGFDVKKVLDSESVKRGLGLTSMRERTELSGGSFSIESTEGKGTVIRAVWPV